MDASDKLTEVRTFASGAGGVVSIATHPVDGGLYYIAWASFVRQISYASSGNLPPIAVASATPTYGPSPLSVQFSSTGSSDPNGDPLIYEWNFSDGSPIATGPNPAHTFNAPSGAPTNFNAILTVADGRGGSSQASVTISVNNTPPAVTITSPIDGSTYIPAVPGDITYTLSAQISDAQTPASLACQWTTILYHDNHTHQTLLAPGCQSTTTTVAALGCGLGGDPGTYHWGFRLSATDPQGLATTREVQVYPDCSAVDTTPPSVPTGLTGTAVSSSQINLAWSPSTDAGSGVSHYKVYRNNAFLAQTATTNYSDTGLSRRTVYKYRVSAVDQAGNESARSAQKTVKTP